MIADEAEVADNASLREVQNSTNCDKTKDIHQPDVDQCERPRAKHLVPTG